MVGGNGWEPRFCVSVCLQLLPRKTRPERRWDLISGMEAWQETGSSGGVGVKGGVCVCVGLNIMSSQRRQKCIKKEDSHPALMAHA